MSISLTIDDPLAIFTIDNPPVNATSWPVRRCLKYAAQVLDECEGIQAVILICAGKTFVAGADIKEFGQPPRSPHLPDVYMAIEQARLPWVAAIHGSALGGGLELAMACRTRLATHDAKFGLPEVNLGLIPGAGGTVRLPRLVVPEAALEMIVGGKPISAQRALDLGLIDEMVDVSIDGSLLDNAKACALELLESGALSETSPARSLERAIPLPEDMSGFEKAAAKFLAKAKGQNAPRVAVDTLRDALRLPADVALKQERAQFQALKNDPQSLALRHIFFAERATTRLPELKGIFPRKLEQIGVIGGGTMGAGIAAACLMAGYAVVMIERDAAAAQVGSARVTAIIDAAHKRGLLTDSRLSSLCAAFQAETDYAALAQADLVIEAVFEDMDVKHQVFAKLDRVTKPDAILASNTSYLDVAEIARATQNPERVLGLHFFSPAHIMKLLEVVRPDTLALDVLATALAFAKQLGKTAVISGVCDGFIANRIMSAYRKECEYMLEDGALPWQIDRAMRDYGLPMGLFEMQDLAGLDISWAMRKRRLAELDPNAPQPRYVNIPDKLCELGRFGRKTGRGWYLYDDNNKASIDPEVEALIESESKRKGIQRQAFSDEDIMQRILAVMKSEAEAILAEGVARCADDIDVVMVHAYGFPRWRGGPLYATKDA